jgi:hypothetical protein
MKVVLVKKMKKKTKKTKKALMKKTPMTNIIEDVW